MGFGIEGGGGKIGAVIVGVFVCVFVVFCGIRLFYLVNFFVFPFQCFRGRRFRSFFFHGDDEYFTSRGLLGQQGEGLEVGFIWLERLAKPADLCCWFCCLCFMCLRFA